MGSISLDSLVLDRAAYAQRRSDLRAAMIDLRKHHRVRLGDLLILEFENPETLQYQVQEMVYTEGISTVQAAREEVEAYSRYLPTRNRLAATLFVALDDPAKVRDVLDRFNGVQHGIELHIGDSAVRGVEVVGADEDGPSTTMYSVHFVEFVFNDSELGAFHDPAVACELRVDHAEYRAATKLDDEIRQHLIQDLDDA